ncbi:MAG: SPOR domain-containing protein [Gammaproteobacteria bacterium]
MDAPPAWTLLFTGLITGIAVGVFGCFLLYLSGKVPPLQSQQTTLAAGESAPRQIAPSLQAEEVRPAEQTLTVVAADGDPGVDEEAAEEVAEESPIGLSFYDELRDYEVPVNTTPVPLAVEIAVEPRRAESAPARGGDRRLLQIGAFQQASSAERQVGMLDDLGVAAFIKQETVPGGRVLHLVQAGPFDTPAELNRIRSLLQVNDINSFPLDPR